MSSIGRSKYSNETEIIFSGRIRFVTRIKPNNNSDGKIVFFIINKII